MKEILEEEKRANNWRTNQME